MGLLEYVAGLEKDKAKLESQLREVDIAIRHDRRTIQFVEFKQADLSGGVPASEEAVEAPKSENPPYVAMGNEAAIVKLLNTNVSRGALRTAEIADLLIKGEVKKVGEGRRT